LLAMTLVAFSTANAQYMNPSWGYGIGAGGARGDNAGDAEQWVPRIRGFIQKGLTGALSAQIGLSYTELNATDRYSTQTLMGDFRFLLRPFEMSQVSPYLYAGVGATKDMGYTASQWLPMVPAGIGIQTKLGDQLMLGFSGGYNLSLSDKFTSPAGSNTINDFTGKKNGGFFDLMVDLVYTTKTRDLDAEREAAKKEEMRMAIEKQKQDAELAKVAAKNDSANHVAEMNTQRDNMNHSAEMNSMQNNMSHAAEIAALREKALRDSMDLVTKLKAKTDTIFVLVKGTKIILRGINFEFNKANILPGSEIVLEKARASMVANQDVTVIISGFTDNVGSDEYNRSLSLKRAQAVKDWLVANNIASGRMKVMGMGKTEPMAPNDTDDGRAQNRRIEFAVE